MDISEFDQEEWQQILDEFRLLVMQSGFSDWDSAMVQALDEAGVMDPDRELQSHTRSPVDQLRFYAREFTYFLKTRSNWAQDHRSNELSELLRTESGDVVKSCIVDFHGRRISLSETNGDIDKMINFLGQLQLELSGEPSQFWSDETGGENNGD